MSYIVLARKWRPQSFADLTGQDHVARTLTNAIELGRVPHAMLFTGARGVGKTSSARIIAMALNCASGPTPKPCGHCSSCLEIQRGTSVDVIEIDGASNRGIGEIRELRDGVRYAPQRDRHKIYIIDEVHMLTTEAFNALLKTLEEPPPHVVFLFATTEVHKIPVTILSRCQRFDFRRIGHADIVARLTHIVTAEGMAVEPAVLHLVARQAQGGMRDALSLLDQIIAFAGPNARLDQVAELLGAAERTRLFELSRAILERRVDEALLSVDRVAAFGGDIGHYTEQLIAHIRDLTVVRVAPTRRDLTALSDAEHEEARAQVSARSTELLQRMFEELVAGADAISRSLFPRLLLEMAIVRLCAMEELAPLDDLIARFDAIAGGRKLPAGRSSAGSTGSAPAESPRTGQPTSGLGTTPSPVAKPVAHEPPSLVASGASAPGPTPVAPGPVSPAPAPEPVVAPAPREAAITPPVAASVDDAPQARPADAAVAVEAPPRTDDAAPAEPVGAEAWRGLVDDLRRLDARLGNLLANAWFLAGDTGGIRIALPQILRSKVSKADHAMVAEAALTRLGVQTPLVVVDESSVSQADLAEGYRLSDVEYREQDERQLLAETALREHQVTQALLGAWPGSTVEVRVRDLY